MINSEDIWQIQNEEDFNEIALEVFKFQFENNRVYRSFCDLLVVHPSDISHFLDIPFLPIQFFKSHTVLIDGLSAETKFYSSGTSNTARSIHYVSDLEIYESSFVKGFELQYGPIEGKVILALLPSYLQQNGSSLVYMAKTLIEKSKNPNSGFYLNNLGELSVLLRHLNNTDSEVILLGVTYALLDLIADQKFNLYNTIIMETGGMKGRRKEMIREELHNTLKLGFGVEEIHSEYGMTELLSQAYSLSSGLFNCPPWMKVLVRSIQDPLEIINTNKTGGINIIDLANLNSCSFIATQDLGKVDENGSFEVLGRFDTAEIRGCNLMVL